MYKKAIDNRETGDKANYTNMMKDENKVIIKYVKYWTGLIDLHSYIQRMDLEDERNTAQSIMELLEMSVMYWNDDQYDNLWVCPN